MTRPGLTPVPSTATPFSFALRSIWRAIGMWRSSGIGQLLASRNDVEPGLDRLFDLLGRTDVEPGARAEERHVPVRARVGGGLVDAGEGPRSGGSRRSGRPAEQRRERLAELVGHRVGSPEDVDVRARHEGASDFDADRAQTHERHAGARRRSHRSSLPRRHLSLFRESGARTDRGPCAGATGRLRGRSKERRPRPGTPLVFQTAGRPSPR